MNTEEFDKVIAKQTKTWAFRCISTSVIHTITGYSLNARNITIDGEYYHVPEDLLREILYQPLPRYLRLSNDNHRFELV
jgi:hypothetical protein